MECHKCKWNDRRPSKAKTAACSNCVLPPDRVNHKGRTFVSMDSGRTAEKVAKEKAEAPAPSSLDGVLPKCCQETASRLLGFLEALGDSDRNLAMRILQGKSHTELAKARADLCARLERFAPDAPFEGPVALSVTWVFRTRGGQVSGWRTAKPDTDNLEKLLKDCMTRTRFWIDDAQVCDERVLKMWSKSPGICIVVRTL